MIPRRLLSGLQHNVSEFAGTIQTMLSDANPAASALTNLNRELF